MSIRDSLVNFLGSLKVKNKAQLDQDIQLYSYTPESIAVGYICSFNKIEDIIHAFSSRYEFSFSKAERRELIKLIEKAKTPTGAGNGWTGYGY